MNRKIGFGVLSLLLTTAVYANPVVESEIKAFADQFANAWNRHDAKSMGAMWAPDGDLINPYGRIAKGPAEVEKLFSEEHAGVMKKSTYKNVKMSVRPLTADLAFADWDVEISGMVDPAGKALPVQKAHVVTLLKKANGKWWNVSARAFDYQTMPAMAKK